MKKLLIVGVAVVSLVLSGCDIEETKEAVMEDFSNRLASVAIPFEWFKLEDIEVAEKKIPEVKGLVLEEETIPFDELDVLKESLLTVGNIVIDKETFKNVASGKEFLEDIIPSEVKDRETDWRALEGVIKHIAEVDHQWIESFSVRSIGKKKFLGSESYVAGVEVNSINDTENYNIYPLELSFDGDGKITSIVEAGKHYQSAHTVKTITEDAYLYENTHFMFLEKWEELRAQLVGVHTYEENKEEALQGVASQMNLNEDLENLIFLAEKGRDLEHTGFTAYLLDDKNLEGITYYELMVSSEDGYHAFTVAYSRGEDKITSVQTGRLIKTK